MGSAASRKSPPVDGVKPGKKKCLTSGRLGWGEAGLLAGTLLAALADVHAAVAAVLVQGRPQDAAGPGLQGALAAALSVHALSKCAVAWASGGWHYAVAAGGGVLLHTGVFVAVLSLV